LVDDLEKQLTVATGHYQTLMEKDVPAFNQMLAAKGKEPLIMAGTPEQEEEDAGDDDDDFADADAADDPAEAD